MKLADFSWTEIVWRHTCWHIGYIYIDGEPQIGFISAVDETEEPCYAGNLIEDFTDKAMWEIRVAFQKSGENEREKQRLG